MRRAFTLLELMLVLALLVVLTALAFPSLTSMDGYWKVTGAADKLKSGYASARAAAIDHGRPYRFAILEGKSNFRIAPDSEGFWSGGQTSDAIGGEIVIYESALPKGIVFSSSDNPNAIPADDEETIVDGRSINAGQYKTLAVFLADGTADQDVKVTLQCRGATPVVVLLRGLTGTVTTRKGVEAVEEEP